MAAGEAASVLLLTKQAELQAAGLLKGGNAAVLLKACLHALCTIRLACPAVLCQRSQEGL